MQISVKQDGQVDPYAIEVKSRDIVAWEASGRGRSVSDLSSPSMTAIYELAHLAARRTGKTDLSLEAFKAACDVVVEDVDGDEVTDPTRDTAH